MSDVSLVRMLHPRLGERHVRIKAVGKMRQNGWTVADEVEDEAKFFLAGAGVEDASLVRVVNPRNGFVRHVQPNAVDKMTQAGWRVVELDLPQDEPPEPSKPKRRRKSPSTSEAPETDSGAFSHSETEQEGE